MRTTLDIDDDLMRAAKELASREKLSIGQVVSRLLRESFAHGGAAAKGPGVGGFRPFPAGDRVVTNDEVDALRDADGM
jgi:Arc/MetJ family transcription regulator